MWLPILFVIGLQQAAVLGKHRTRLINATPLLHAYPCINNTDITISYEPYLPPEEENQYYVYIKEDFITHSTVVIKFDSEVTVTLGDKSVARITAWKDEFNIVFFKNADHLNFKVKGSSRGTFAYITSLVINTAEYCEEPNIGFLDSYLLGYQDKAEISLTVPDSSCGRRKVQHTELITNGLPTKPGDWPWHVAIYRLQQSSIKYICGGSLLSKKFVLTAGHCVTVKGVKVLPEIISVVLGKYNLIGGDIATQEKEVHEIIVHEDYDTKLNNDIALLKLRTEAIFGDYVQPSCLWDSGDYKKLPQGDLYGTVVGWGFDHTDALSSQLKQAFIPKISDLRCIKSNPVFFGEFLNNMRFCAGLNNGTSACNGDSGGGFHVFVPDTSQDTSANAPGSWHVRGIVSLSRSRRDIALCDPSQYVLFTDVSKYKGWIKKHVQDL